jgi:hypothetical protein
LCLDSKSFDRRDEKFKRQWSFSNLVSFCRIHLFNYIHLTKFLESQNEWKLDAENNNQLGIFDDYLAIE